MTILEFNEQVKRLSDTYGAQHYRQERLSILWGQVRDYGADWFKRVVSGLISLHRQAPLPADFGEAIALERERQWRREKEQNERESKNFWAGTHQPDDVKLITQAIKKRIQGGLSDDQWQGFVSTIDPDKKRGA